MTEKNDYSDFLDRIVDEDPVVRESSESIQDFGVDYRDEFRKQTGRNLETGEIEVQ